MSSLFCRMHSDRSEEPVGLENVYAGPVASACWLIGGGPSLDAAVAEKIEQSPAPKMMMNLSGAGLLRPTFWTSYDPSVRFHKSIYLDPSVTKFVHKRRAMDLVPETSFKVCDCPNLYFFERERERQFVDFVSMSNRGIVDWADSFVQAIDILFRLGFRTLYLAGCEMTVKPSMRQDEHAKKYGVVYEPGELLKDFLNRCQQAGVSETELEKIDREKQYHFDEQKSLRAAANSEYHYFRIAQYLRLSRRAMALAGLQLVSVTVESRLNDYFPFIPVEAAVENIVSSTGDPVSEKTNGLYRQLTDRRGDFEGPMRDFKPPYDLEATPEKLDAVAQPEMKSVKPEGGGQEILIEDEGYEVGERVGRTKAGFKNVVGEMRKRSVMIEEV